MVWRPGAIWRTPTQLSVTQWGGVLEGEDGSRQEGSPEVLLQTTKLPQSLGEEHRRTAGWLHRLSLNATTQPENSHANSRRQRRRGAGEGVGEGWGGRRRREMAADRAEDRVKVS